MSKIENWSKKEKTKTLLKIINYKDYHPSLLKLVLTDKFEHRPLFQELGSAFNLVFATDRFLNPRIILDFKEKLDEYCQDSDHNTQEINFKIEFQFDIPDFEVLKKRHFQNLKWYLENFCKQTILPSHYRLVNKKALVELESDQQVEQLNTKLDELNGFMAMIGFEGYKVKFFHNENKDVIIEPIISYNDATKILTHRKTTDFKSQNKITQKNTPAIEDILRIEGPSNVQGEIIELKHLTTRANKKYVEILLTNWTTSINAFAFNRVDKFLNYKVGDWVELSITTKRNSRNNRWHKEIIFADEGFSYYINGINSCEPLLKRNISSKDKNRVELSTHSKMSAHDSTCSVNDIINNALNAQMPAVAILDFNSVQAFPEINNHPAVKAKKIKPIYGMQATLINDDNSNSVSQINPEQNKDFFNQKFCVFDLETTGLYPNVHDVIEFGCCLFDGKSPYDSQTESFFIKINYKIPEFIVQHTNITDDILEKEGLDPITACKKILKIIDNRILVAHNAKFDLTFLNNFLVKNNFEPIKNSVIDTMWLARHLYPQYSRYDLNSLASKIKVTYDTTSAHRADYDADVLYKLFAHNMMDEIKKNLNQNENISLKQLNEIRNPQARARDFGHHVSLLAKNKQGVQELYQLISKMSTETIYKFSSTNNFGVLKLLSSDLTAKRKNILVGSHATNGEVINAIWTKTIHEIKNIIQFYDYIEIPHPALLGLLCFEKTIPNYQIIEEKINLLIKICTEMNKKYVAVSDAYYLHPWQKQTRDSYIFTKALRGRNHPLYSYNLRQIIELNKNDDASTSLYDQDAVLLKMFQALPAAHFHFSDDLYEEFDFISDKKVLANLITNFPQEIASEIEFIDLSLNKLYPPIIKDAFLQVAQSSKAKFLEIYHDSQHQIFQDRLKLELETIEKHQYGVIYYLCHLLAKNSEKSNYIIGSRGSVGSSFVAFLLNITEVNPLPPHYYCSACPFAEFASTKEYDCGYDLPKRQCPECNIDLLTNGHNIPFETFLGISGDKVPDIDLNFSGEYQLKAHEFIKNYIGAENVYRSGTISTYAEKTALGLVLSYIELVQSRLSKHNITSAHSKVLQKFIVGGKRSSGQHPGGLIVIPKNKSIFDFTPYNFPADNMASTWKTTHLPFEVLHDSLLKLDLLGHDDPTILKNLYDSTGHDPKSIPFNDNKVLNLFSGTSTINYKTPLPISMKVATLGIPEFGTKLARTMLIETNPQTFSDLVKISGLSHGKNVWNNNLRELVYVKKEKTLQEVIGSRDDIMTALIGFGLDKVFAFQIMESVRRGKQIPAALETVVKKHHVPAWFIDICNKINYLFPKAHATAYVIMAYRIAWYKLYFPLEFYAAHLSTRFDNFDYETLILNDNDSLFLKYTKYNKNVKQVKNKDLMQITEILFEMIARGFRVDPISITKSHPFNFVVDHTNDSIIAPLSSIEGLGAAAAQKIASERMEKPFDSADDFLERTRLSSKIKSLFKQYGILKTL